MTVDEPANPKTTSRLSPAHLLSRLRAARIERPRVFWRWIALVVAGILVVAVGTPVLVWQLKMVEVPDLAELHGDEASALLEDLPLDVEWPDWARSEYLSYYVLASQNPAAGTRVDPGSVLTLGLDIAIPDLDGSPVRWARTLIDRLGLKATFSPAFDTDFVDFFTVKGVKPGSGSVVASGATVEVAVAPKTVAAPEVTGATYSDAVLLLKGAGYRGAMVEIPVLPAGFVGTADEVSAAFKSPGNWIVVTQSVAAGTRSPAGAVVDLALQPPVVVVPDLAGMTVSDASSALHGLGLNAGSTGISGSWKVQSQTPPAGGSVLPGGTVQLAAQAPQIVFTVSGNGSEAMVTWAAPGSFSIQQDTSASLPWSRSWNYSAGSIYGRGNFNAQMYDGDEITCTITIDGKVVQSNTSTGAYAVVSCG